MPNHCGAGEGPPGKRIPKRRIRRTVAQLCPELSEIVLEGGRRNDLQYAGGRVPGIPERVPLLARLEDQISRIADHDGVAEHRPDAALEDETVFVLAMMPVHGRRQGARLHRMFDNSEALAGIVPVDHEAGAGAAENCEMTIMRAECSRRCHGVLPGELRIARHIRGSGGWAGGGDRDAGCDDAKLAARCSHRRPVPR
ncbi:hypothetical protein ACVIGA_008285 [Bradyrhizobium sp. USDA 3240]